MSSSQYKALTFIHFPFTDRSFSPGDMFDRSEFEESAEEAAKVIPAVGDYTPTTAEEMIGEFLKYGSISEDPNAPLHPDHVPVEPGKPTFAGLIEQAKDMVATLERNGQDVPDELRSLSETDYRHVVSEGDAGTGGDKHGNG